MARTSTQTPFDNRRPPSAMAARWRPLCWGLTCAGLCALSSTLWHHYGPWFVVNVTPSMPRGVYRIVPVHAWRVGMLLLFQPPDDLRALLHDRGILPADTPLLKPVVAVAGDVVCVSTATVSVNGIGVATLSPHVSPLLPHMDGCVTLTTDHVFPLSARHPASVDGRYFGPVPTSRVLGEAVPVWLWDAEGL